VLVNKEVEKVISHSPIYMYFTGTWTSQTTSQRIRRYLVLWQSEHHKCLILNTWF